jgi:hypothetical protein
VLQALKPEVLVGPLWVMGGRRKCSADDAALLPVNPQVRTRAGSLANFRLCAMKRLMHCTNFEKNNDTHL